MIPSTFCVLLAVLSSLAAANGAVVQRDGTFTFLTPQPTAGGAASTTVTTSSLSSVTTTAPTTASSGTSTRPTTVITPTTTVPSTASQSPSTTPTVTATTKTVSPVTSTTIPTSTQGAVDCNGVQQWQAAFAYSAGAKVIFNGQLYTAKQWTYNNAPPTHPDQWTANGICAQPINNKANCNGVGAWSSNVAYNAGNQVTFNGHLWSAVQWTFSNAPGDASGSWKDLGACA